MSRIHRRGGGRGPREEADVDVTPFLNLMIVLVPVLLLSLAFTETTVLELNVPKASAGATDAARETLRLEVWIYPDELVLADAGRGELGRYPATADGDPDFPALAAKLVQIKARAPEHEQIKLLSAPAVPYELLVATMDAVRVFPAGVAPPAPEDAPRTTPEVGALLGPRTEAAAPLFPKIALGDAPARSEPGLAAVTGGTP